MRVTSWICAGECVWLRLHMAQKMERNDEPGAPDQEAADHVGEIMGIQINEADRDKADDDDDKKINECPAHTRTPPGDQRADQSVAHKAQDSMVAGIEVVDDAEWPVGTELVGPRALEDALETQRHHDRSTGTEEEQESGAAATPPDQDERGQRYEEDRRRANARSKMHESCAQRGVILFKCH